MLERNYVRNFSTIQQTRIFILEPSLIALKAHDQQIQISVEDMPTTLLIN